MNLILAFISSERVSSIQMNQLQSELRLARSLIAEKDSEIQRVRNTNNQYVEENERLRAILGEWSTTAAKLERALEAERISNLELQKKLMLKSQTHKNKSIPRCSWTSNISKFASCFFGSEVHSVDSGFPFFVYFPAIEACR
ncbi:UNVERIFIED_CONTAM: protein FIP1 [Sesamum radiatum]|uniref:Protein FIP1 n=1 Tax=Sesamum radiatum TaxID=300843 RepID=A0AAW2R367_SESRA